MSRVRKDPSANAICNTEGCLTVPMYFHLISYADPAISNNSEIDAAVPRFGDFLEPNVQLATAPYQSRARNSPTADLEQHGL
jgi:hypothetical protein